MKKTIGYYIFAIVYYICRLFPTGDKRVLGIMTHDDGEGNNVTLIIKELIKKEQGYSYSYIYKKDTLAAKSFKNIRALLSFFFIKPYKLARANIILMDNVFLPLAFLRIRKGVKVIQLWHGTGTIKKFGQDVNKGRLKRLEEKANRNITHLTVNSHKIKQLYSSAFGISQNRVHVTGLPKTDVLLRHIAYNKARNSDPDKDYIYDKYSISKDKKLILYAPTFRDHENNTQAIINVIDGILSELPKEYRLGLRLHPYIADNLRNTKLESKYTGKVITGLSFEKDINQLLMASDILITDYSSIIFEYCLMGRPMIFYAYDLEEFDALGRGFYYDYESFVPGPIASSGGQVCDIIKSDAFDMERIQRFKEENMPFLDGRATNRIIDLIEDASDYL